MLLPWAAVSLLRGSGGLALGLTVTYAAAAFARSALEPRLLGRQIGLPPLLTLLSLYAGYRLFGLAGMILLPLAVLLAKQVWSWRRGMARASMERCRGDGMRRVENGKWKVESFARLPIRTGRRENGMHQLRL